MIFPCSDRALLHSEAEKVPAIAAQRHILAKHILPTITPTPVDTFPSVSGGFAGHSNGKLLIFICPLDFCAGLHILKIGNASVRIA